MIEYPARDDPSHDDAPTESLTDPAALRGRTGIPFEEETAVHDDRDHCNADVAGRAVVAATDDEGATLLLVNDELGIALLPHGTVDPGADWAAVARREAEGQTGVAVDLETVAAVRSAVHVVDGEDDPHARTHRVVFDATPAGGTIQDCKRSADAGSDAWRAGWFHALPEGVTPPGPGPEADVELAFE